MKFSIIVGSHRADSQSSKVGKYIEHQLKQLFPQAELYTLDLRLNPLPLWSEEVWQENTALQKLWQPYSDKLASADAFIIISPEWSGMVPAGLKNIFLYCNDNELANKPALIVSVSSSRGGAYPIAELRMSSYKNTHVCYIPEHVIVRNVEAVLNDLVLNESNKDDFYIKNRMAYCLKILEKYASALKQVRESGVFDYKTYPYGM